MKRALPFAAFLLVFACSRGPGDAVLEVELAPAGGAVTDAASLAKAAAVIARRLDGASPRNSRVQVSGSQLVVGFDAEGAADWPALKEFVRASGGLAFVAIATDPPFGEELAIEARNAGIQVKHENGEWAFEALDHDRAALLKTMSERLASVTANDPRWTIAPEALRAGDDPRVVLLDHDGAMEHVAVTSARAQDDPMGPRVDLTLSAEDARRFAALTGRLVRRKLAILVDGDVKASPVVMEAISGGNVQIAIGAGTPDAKREAQKLAASLAAGDLPFPLEIRAERTVAARR